MTAHDHWKTSAPEPAGEEWEEACDVVAGEYFESLSEASDAVSILANADGALNYLMTVNDIPSCHIHEMRDLVRLVSSIRRLVEDEVKDNRRMFSED